MKINRKQLIDMLEKIKPGLAGNKEIIEHSNAFAFLAGESVMAYNDKIAIFHYMDTGIKGVVQAEELLSLLKRIKKDEVEVNMETGLLCLLSGRTKAGIVLQADLPVHVLQMQAIINKEKKWKKLPTNFVEGVKICMPSVSEDMTRPELTVLHLHNKFMEASDNYRLTRFRLSEAIQGTLHIPADNLAGIEKIMPATYSVDASWIYFRNEEGVIYCCRLLGEDIKFPDISPFLKSKGIKVVMPTELKEALDRTMVFAGKGQADVFPQVEITLGPKWITIKGKGVTGWIEEKMRVKYDGEEVNFYISPKLLMDVFDHKLNVQVTKNTLLLSNSRFIHCCAIQAEEK